jgi:hypothetical protein
MTLDYGFWITWAVPGVFTPWCWWRIFKSDDPRWFKIVLAAIAALPFFGPIFYFFIQMPPRLPEYARAKMG